MKTKDKLDFLAEHYPSTLTADGLDDAIIGYCAASGTVIYDYDKCLGILMLDQDFTEEEAIDWMEYNVLGAYVGEGTPIFKIDYIEEEVYERLQ